jgi:hypothetical protein
MADDRRRGRPRRGRVEAALELDLQSRPQIGPAERAALRSQARAIDVAESAADAALVTGANHGYLELRKAAGLTAAGARAADPFDELLAQLGRPTAGASDSTPPG